MTILRTFLLLLFACDTTGPKIQEGSTDSGALQDKDNDGYYSDEDCDDSNSGINPGSIELCDGLDNNCDGEIDEAVEDPFYIDEDGDGFGDMSVMIYACETPEGYTANGNDCDDGSSITYPGAAEQCDGLDNNCDGEIDENLLELWYEDADGDGFGNAESEFLGCNPGSGFVDDNSDCDDTLSAINPDANEICDEIDNDCDMDIDEDVGSNWYLDADSDGFGDPLYVFNGCTPPSGYVDNDSDCDDIDTFVNPLAIEICDYIDNDCNGNIDEANSADAQIWYSDLDQDTFGDPQNAQAACYQPNGYVLDNSDCDDSRLESYPNADEYCNGFDDDCNGTIDDTTALDALLWYEDNDSDGYGNINITTNACSSPSGYVSDNTDCDDTRSLTYPNADEYCNGIDDDCDNTLDESAVDAFSWYYDSDGDSFGDPSITEWACNAPINHVLDNTDCNDALVSVYPGADEYCNGIDDDCDSTIDEGDSVDVSLWFIDTDGDGFGDDNQPLFNCYQPGGYVADNSDCDDTNPTTNPDAFEYCNGVDDDCTGAIDEAYAVDVLTWYADLDSDLFGDPSLPSFACNQPSSYVSDNTDCDDSLDTVYPSAIEYCNNIDDDCNNQIDEEGALGEFSHYLDNDSDGYGNPTISIISCITPSGYSTDNTDCNDGNPNISPGANEFCNGVDDDCDNAVDENTAIDAQTWYIDTDGDNYGNISFSLQSCNPPGGYVSNATDCNDTAVSINPAASEFCNGVDDNCNNQIDENSSVNATMYYRDFDNDGFGDPLTSTPSCTQPNGYVTNNLDCNDGLFSVNPNASEYCNGYDDNCNNAVDENNALDALVWYQDADNDGYGNLSFSQLSCYQPAGYVPDLTDCNDGNSAINPGANERCNGMDDDCDNAIDENSAIDAPTWYFDGDGDNYGISSSTVQSCSQPSGYAPIANDCNDGIPSINPGETELCNGFDDNCDNVIDDSSSSNALTWYRDADGDGYGSPTNTTQACSQPNGYISDSSDCNDGSNTVFPGAAEYCNGIDDDCDFSIDENAVNLNTWYGDGDNDGYGHPANSNLSCNQPAGFVADANDCNDGNSSINPGAAEQCNLTDNNCNGQLDDGISCRTTIYRFFHPTRAVHFYSRSITEGTNGGYNLEGVSYYLYTNSAPGLLPYYRCYSPTIQRHLFTTDSNCEILPNAYVEDTLGYIASSSVNGAIQLYRSFYPTTHNHFYTTSYSEYLSALNSGYQSEIDNSFVWSSP